jgi:hypothetical protein
MTYKIVGREGVFVCDVDENQSPDEQVNHLFKALLNSFLDIEVKSALKEYMPTEPRVDRIDQIRNIIASMSNLVGGHEILINSLKKHNSKILRDIEFAAIENQGEEVIWSDYSSIAHIYVKAKFFLSREDNKTTITIKDSGSIHLIPKKEINSERPYFKVNRGDIISINGDKEIVLTIKKPEVTITSPSPLPSPQQQPQPIQKY